MSIKWPCVLFRWPKQMGKVPNYVITIVIVIALIFHQMATTGDRNKKSQRCSLIFDGDY